METSQQRGFTMVELVVVIGIVGILLAIGAPSYKYVTTSNRIAGEINGLVGDLQFARAEAIKEGLTVTVCASSDGATCIGGGSAWTTGWIVFSDTGAIGSFDGNDVLLRVQKPLSGGDTLTSTGTINAVTFNREGFAQSMPGVTMKLHDPTNNNGYTRCLSITIVGAMANQNYGTGSCT